LLVVDAHSKWCEVFHMTQTTATKTVEILCQLLSSYGLPEQVVFDNGSQFVSDDFHQFMQGNGIQHIRSTWVVEQFVRTFKEVGRNDGL